MKSLIQRAEAAASETNRLLAALPPADYQRLYARLERVPLAKHQVLHEPDEPSRSAFFPLSGFVSLQALGADGTTVEVAAVGREGLVGLPIVFDPNGAPCTAVVQIPGVALRLSADALVTEFRRCEAFQVLLLRYARVLLAQTAQAVVCHQFHSVAQRLSRWLLTARDYAATNSLDVTQELIAGVLGVPRTCVSKAAADLQAADIIRIRHGHIAILDAVRLEAASCECYAIVRAAIRWL